MIDRSTRPATAPGTIPAAMAVGWTLAVILLLAFLPVYSSSSTSTSSDAPGVVTTTSTSETIFEVNGIGVLVPLLIPTAVALLGLVGVVFRSPALVVAAAGVATGFCLLAMLSVGVFYLPAAILLVIAAVRSATSSRSEGWDPGPLDPSTPATLDEPGIRLRSILVGGCLGWAVLGVIVTALTWGDANDDAKVVIGLAAGVGIAAALAAAWLLARGRDRLAGLALLASVVIPTYFMWILNVPALVVGFGLLATGRVGSDRPSTAAR